MNPLVTVRITRPELYDHSCSGHTNVSARQGYYVDKRPDFFDTTDPYQMAEKAVTEAGRMYADTIGKDWLVDVQVPGFARIIRCARIPKHHRNYDPNKPEDYKWVAALLPVMGYPERVINPDYTNELEAANALDS